MAHYKAELPNELIKRFSDLEAQTRRVIGEWTRVGAKVVYDKVKANVPLPEMSSHVHMSKTYDTPTDGAINTKVYLSGYIPFTPPRTTFSRSGRNGKTYVTDKGVPVEFLANLYEYGRSNRPFPKKPFLRKSFSQKDIDDAILEYQNRQLAHFLGMPD